MKFRIDHKSILIAIVFLVGTFAILTSTSLKAADVCDDGSSINSAKFEKKADGNIKKGEQKINIEEFRRQREQISGLNLINGLYLTEEQLANLIPLAREARQLEEEIRTELIEINCKEEFKDALSDHVNNLIRGNQPDTNLKQRLNKYHGKEVELHQALENKKLELGLKAIDILTSEQMALVAEFKPCLIAPQDENSTLTGQAAGGHGVQEGLRKMRRIPQRIWDKRKDKYLEKLIARNELHSSDFLDVDEEKTRIDSIIKQAREYSDAEFEVHIQELSMQLLLDNPTNYHSKSVARKVGNLILNRDMEEVYLAKLDMIQSEKRKLVASGEH